MRTIMQWQRDERGTSALEIALILPVLLTMMFGLVEAGFFYFADQTVEKAAQLASRTAATGIGHDDGTRMQRILDTVGDFTSPLQDRGAFSTTVESFAPGSSSSVGGAGGPCDIVEVAVEYTYPPLTPMAGELFGVNIVVSGVERMVNEPWLSCDEG